MTSCASSPPSHRRTPSRPLLDWRLDYDFHDGNPDDSNTSALRLKTPDLAFTTGGAFPTQATLIGPCDPAQVPRTGSAPVPSTGTGCWESVTTNDSWTFPAGTPDFSATAPVDKELTIGFEVRNALNTGSSVAKHRIAWKVPDQLLKSSSILSGGMVEDLSEGSPLTTGFRWYFAQARVGETGDDVLTLKADCAGTTCTPPSFTQTGSYRYWVSVPYRGGFRTAECPGLLADQVTCSGDAGKTVAVTDVVLSLTAPTQVLVGTPNVTISSASAKGATVVGCPSDASSFSYEFCTPSGTSCSGGGYTSSGLVLNNPFPSAGSGSFSIPNPGVGTWGLRIRYSYTTQGSCTFPTVVQWPASGWSPLTVLQSTPTIRLRNATDTADIPYVSLGGGGWELTTGETARLYVYLNDVRDANPPSSLAWYRTPYPSGAETAIGTTQGASFSLSTAGEYVVILRGYGSDVTTKVSAAPAGGGGPTGPPTVSSVIASPSSPTVNQTVNFTCNATQGGAPITSYSWVLDSGVTRTTSSASTSYAYGTVGTKTFSCTAKDSTGATSSTRVSSLTVQPASGGSCSFVINDAQGLRLPYDSSSRTYGAVSGQPLTFVASGVDSSVSWNFGDGVTASTNPANHTYNVTQLLTFTVTLTSGSCTQTSGVEITAPSGPTFTVVDATTGAALPSPAGTWEASTGQSLRFNAIGTTGAVSWSFGDGETSAAASPVKTYSPLTDTTYTVTLTNNSLSRQSNIKIKGLTGSFTYKYSDGAPVSLTAVQPNKPILFTAVDRATTFTWDFGDGVSGVTGSPKEHTFTRGGTFAVRLTVALAGVPGTVTTSSPPAFKVLPPPDPLLWVAGGMAYSDGLNGARWQSDLSVYNPGSQTADISLGFVSGEGWAGSSNVQWIPKALRAGETWAVQNVLKELFALAKGAWGVVLVRGDDVPLPPVIVSRTYNAASVDENGTFGLSVPALSVSAGVRPQSAAASNFLVDLRQDASFRTNLTVANLGAETAEVEVVFRDAAGIVLGSSAKITVEANGVKQLNAALSAAPAIGTEPIGGAGWSGPVAHFTAEVKLKRGTGVYPYATVIDQGTGDSIVVIPTPRPSATYRLPGVVRVKKGDGSYWVSDVALLNPSALTRKVLVTYSYEKGGTPGRSTTSNVITLSPKQLLVAVDFVRLWLGLQEDDATEYSSSFVDFAPASDDPAPTEPLVVNGKTYTPSEEGSSGLQVDPFVFEDGVGTQTSDKRIVLSGLEANDRFRTNVALFLTPGATGSDSAQVDVQVYSASGLPMGPPIGVSLSAADKPVLQLNSSTLFGNEVTRPEDRATVVISNPRGTARVGAYATVIDNRSEDATFVAGQPAP